MALFFILVVPPLSYGGWGARDKKTLLLERGRPQGRGDHVPVHRLHAFHRDETRLRGDAFQPFVREPVSHLPYRSVSDRGRGRPAHTSDSEACRHRVGASLGSDVPRQRVRRAQRGSVSWGATHPAMAANADSALLSRDGLVDFDKKISQRDRPAARPLRQVRC